MTQEEFKKIKESYDQAKSKENMYDSDKLTYELAIHQVKRLAAKYRYAEADRLETLLNGFRENLVKLVEDASNERRDARVAYLKAMDEQVEVREEKKKEFEKKVVDKEQQRIDNAVKALVALGFSEDEAREKVTKKKG